jgi:hypothetical protein
MRWVSTRTGKLGFFSRRCLNTLTPSSFGRLRSRSYKVIVQLRSCSASLLTVRANIHGIVLAFQSLPNKLGKSFIIFGNKNSHMSEPSLIELLSLVRNRSVAAETTSTRRYVETGMGASFKVNLGG